MNILTRAVRSILWRTGIGRKVGEIYWKKRNEGEDLKYLFYNKKDVFKNIPINFADERYNAFLKKDLEHWKFQEEYILEMDNVTIEPERCLGTKGVNQLIEQTVVYKQDYQYPYILTHLLNRKKTKKIEEAILYDGSATRNYFHHLVEAVSSLSMFNEIQFRRDIPLIINRAMYDQKIFQYLLNNSKIFKSFNWKIQEPNEWLEVSKLYRLRALHFDAKTWKYTKELYNVQDITPFRKVFLSRDKKLYTRGLANEDDVISMLKKYDFEVVYAEHLTVDEQIKVFQETKYLVALTGMGLIQQFFMNYEEAHVIEIIPINRLMPEYYCQAFVLGIKYYDVVLGDDVNLLEAEKNESPKRYEGLKEYNMNIPILEAAVNRMLKAPSTHKIYGNGTIKIN